MAPHPGNSRAFLAALGAAVRTERERLGLSQEELCFRAELDRTYISGIERGVRNPTAISLQRVAHGLGVSLSSLLRRAERTK
jgi:transcriptional regulator with XRE-family HTH domain